MVFVALDLDAFLEKHAESRSHPFFLQYIEMRKELERLREIRVRMTACQQLSWLLLTYFFNVALWSTSVIGRCIVSDSSWARFLCFLLYMYPPGLILLTFIVCISDPSRVSASDRARRSSADHDSQNMLARTASSSFGSSLRSLYCHHSTFLPSQFLFFF